VTTAPVAFRAARIRLGLRADAFTLGGLLVLVGALVAFTWGTWGNLNLDTGYDLVAGARVADGDIPYRDFTYYYGPLAPGLLGLVTLLGGAGLAPAVAVGLVVALVIVATTYLLGRAVAGPAGGFLAAALTSAVAFAPGNFSYVLPHTEAAPLGTLFVLAMILAVWRYSAVGRAGWLAAAGLVLGLATLTKPEPAAAAIAAVSLWLVLRARSGAAARREAALVAGPALLLAALVYGGFLTVVSPGRLLFDNLYPRDFLNSGGNTLLRARMPLTLESAVDLGVKAALYAAGVAVLIAAARVLERRRPSGTVVPGALALGVLAALAALVVNAEALRHGLQLAYGWIPAGVAAAVVVLVVRAWTNPSAWTAPRQIELLGATALAVLALSSYGGFFPHSGYEQMAIYYIPLAATFMARLHLRELRPARSASALGAAWLVFLAVAGIGLTLKDSHAESATVRGPGGELAALPADAALYQPALDGILRRTSPGEPILAAPLMTGLYVLSGHESPLSQISLLPGSLGPDDEQAAIRELDRSGVRVIVTDDRAWPGFGHTSFGESFDRGLAAWIEENFIPATTIRSPGEDRSLVLWTRRST